MPDQLITLVGRESSRAAPPGVSGLTQELRARYGKAVHAILFYGSCFRTGDDVDGLADLYLLVDRYEALSSPISWAWPYKFLRPTVFYLESSVEGRVVRAKVAILTVDDFERGTTGRWFHSYLWGRFAQPTGLLYARDEAVRVRILKALATAVVTFIIRVVPMLTSDFGARELWQRGLGLSYRAELRAERPGTVASLVDAAREYYDAVTRVAVTAAPFSVVVDTNVEPSRYQAKLSRWARVGSCLGWGLRRIQGKALSVLRLTKGLFTFTGGTEYILWKIERHSGVRIELTPRLQRHPLLARGVLIWRLYRRGAFR